MHQLFSVVEDMNNMSMDQLKGAIRNMQDVGNSLHTLFRAFVNADTDKMTVMGLDWDQLAPWIDEINLPSATGTIEVVSKKRSSSLLRWQLEFFNEFGNLALEVDSVVRPTSLVVSDSNAHTETHAGWLKYLKVRKEKAETDAAIYESMRKATKKR